MKRLSDYLYDPAWQRWHRRAQKNAMKVPWYAEMERIRDTDIVTGEYKPDSPTRRFLDDELTMEHLDTQREILHLTRKPLYLRILTWYHFNVDIRRWRRNLRGRWQRGRDGFSESDTWNLNSYLALVIQKSLLRLRDNKNTYPGQLTPERWSEILTTIADEFGMYAVDDSQDISDEAWDLLKQYWGHLWD